MRLPTGTTVEALDESRCEEFFLYLNAHRSDNGKAGTGYFVPASQSDSRFPPEKEKSYRDGLNLPLGSLGWRRAWIARIANGSIIGHVDLWSHPMRFTEHRCLLGMGVDRNHRRIGLGTALLAHTTEWALANTWLEWLDLHVLSTNEAAIRLYVRAGFAKVGEMPDMFRFDGFGFSDIIMTKRLRADPHGAS